MTTTVLRTADARYVQIDSGAVEIDTTATTTAELLRDRAAIGAAADRAAAVSVDTLDLLSPVTAPCRVVAQMTNYASHVKDSGMDPVTTSEQDPLAAQIRRRPCWPSGQRPHAMPANRRVLKMFGITAHTSARIGAPRAWPRPALPAAPQ